MSRALKLTKITRRSRSTIDGTEFDIEFDLGDIRTHTFVASRKLALEVQVSRTLEAIWNLPPDDLGPAAAALAVPHVLDLAREDQLGKV